MDKIMKSKEIIEFYSTVKKELGDICFDNFEKHIKTHRYFLGQNLRKTQVLQKQLTLIKWKSFYQFVRL